MTSPTAPPDPATGSGDADPDTTPLTVEEIAQRYDFGDCCTEAFVLAQSAWSSTPTDGASPDWADVATAVGHGRVTVAFSEWISEAPERPGGLEAFAAQLSEVDGPDGAIGSVLLALAAHEAGDVAAEEAALEAAIAIDSGSTVAAELLSSLAAERGDLDRATRLLRRAGARDDHDELRFFRMLAAQLPSAAKVGRNEPCPCGSGRKFKACCLRSPVLPIDARVTWTLHRMARFAIVGPSRMELLELAISVAEAAAAAEHDDHDHDHAGHDASDHVAAHLSRFFSDPFVCDLIMYEGGIGEVYLAQRGALLTDDERSWVAAWLAQLRRLWEVVDGDRDGNLDLHDAASGASVTVPAVDLGLRPASGTRVLCRLADIAGRPRLGGTLLTVEPDDVATVEALLDPPAAPGEWAAWYGPAATVLA